MDYLSGTTTIECYQVYYLLSKPGALIITDKSIGLVVIVKFSIINHFDVKIVLKYSVMHNYYRGGNSEDCRF